MLVVRRIDIIFNKYTPGRDGCRYEIQPLKIIPTVQFGALFIYCALYEVCLCVFVCVHWRVTQGQWQDSAPAAPCNATHPTAPHTHPHPTLLLWHLPCPYWLDNTQPLYATCPSARLHLREPLSPSLELPLSAFVWILVKPPSSSPVFPRLFLSCSVLLAVALCAVLYKHRHTKRHIQTGDCLCQLFPTSASRHKGLYRLYPSPSLPLTCTGQDASYWGCCAAQKINAACWTR